ncbi:MAG: polysaccharide biosynthesis protein [Clostridiales bacterium]|nr:polysaccharide biosynthesis protein [Clostridiales bacterium]
MSETRKQNYLKGAAILASTVIIAKIIGAVFKIPLYNLLGESGTTNFALTYSIYALLLTISTSGIPVALSRQISAAAAIGRPRQVKRYFSVALPAFAFVGALFAVLMFVYADQLAVIMGDDISAGIRVLSPAVFFVCVVSVFEGYGQGHGNMLPTAAKQIIEVTSKLVFGLAIAWWLLRQGEDTPVVAAGAISGVPIGLGIALAALILYKRKIDRSKHYDGLSAAAYDVPASRFRTLLSIFKVSIPITIGASFMNILTLVDYRLILYRLQSGAGFTNEIAKTLTGVYSMAQTIMIIPSSLIVPLSVSIIPAISAAIANRRHREAKEVMESSLKLTNLFAMPAAAGISILSFPIFNVLYPNMYKAGPNLLMIFGMVSFFICMQMISTGILLANGHERIPMLTFPVGGIIQIVLDWFLVGNPDIGIIGSPIGTLSCYLSISALNFIYIGMKVKNKPNFARVFIKPALCTAVMGIAAWSVYELLFKMGSGVLGSGRAALLVYLVGAIVAAVIVYGILIIATKAITREDMKLVPKGEKIADFLKIK